LEALILSLRNLSFELFQRGRHASFLLLRRCRLSLPSIRTRCDESAMNIGRGVPFLVRNLHSPNHNQKAHLCK